MDDQTKIFGQAVAAGLTNAVGLQRRSTEELASDERRTRNFFQCIRLWDAMLPKRQGDDIGGELMAKGYQRMLGYLTETQMGWLTEMVLDECKWFPTVAECKAMMAKDSYGNRFRRTTADQIGSDSWWETARIEAAAHGRVLADHKSRAITDGGTKI